MSDLNADVLTRIFLNLQFTERVRLETVCQLWHLVLQSNACFSDMRRLDLADFLSNTTADYYQQESISLSPTIMGVVERCGSYVHSLSFGNRWLKVRQHVIDTIASNCTQLRQLDLGAVILNADISDLLRTVAGQLKVLSLEETSWVNNEHAEKMADMLCGFTRLECINLRSAMFSIENMVHLPVSLRQIDISHAHHFSESAMVAFLRQHPRLESLTASPCPVMNQDIMNALSDLPNLTNLSIGFIDDRTIDMSCIARLTGLRSLTLQVPLHYHLSLFRSPSLQSVSCLNETSLLPILSSLTSLCTLSLRRCDRVFDYSSLAFCERLSSLTLTDTMQLSDTDLILLSARCSLRHLHISNCINVTSQGLCYALSHSQLQEFLITHCPSITDEVMYTLVTTQETIRTISIERCIGISSKGVGALAWLRDIRALRSLDISKNRQIDDSAVESLHNALLTLARRPHKPLLSASDTDCHKSRKRREISPAKEQTLTILVAQTSVTPSVETKVKDFIHLIY